MIFGSSFYGLVWAARPNNSRTSSGNIPQILKLTHYAYNLGDGRFESLVAIPRGIVRFARLPLPKGGV